MAKVFAKDELTPMEQQSVSRSSAPNFSELPSLWELLQKTFSVEANAGGGGGFKEFSIPSIPTAAASKRAKMTGVTDDWNDRLPGIAKEDFQRDPCILLALERLQRTLKSLLQGYLNTDDDAEMQEVKTDMKVKKDKIRVAENALREIENLSAYTWEQVNIGHWKTVPRLWRKMYTLLAILKVTLMIFQVCSSRDLIKECDMGLIMGEPILNNVLGKIANELSTKIIMETNELESVSLTTIKTEKDQDVPEGMSGTKHTVELDDLRNITLTTIKTEPEEFSFEPNAPDAMSGTEQTLELGDLPNISLTTIKTEDMECSLESDAPEEMSETKQTLALELAPTCAEFPLRNKSEAEFPLNCTFTPCLQEFLSYVRGGQPVLIFDIVDHWPAMKKWNVDYIDKVAGFRTVPVEIGSAYTSQDWTQKVMTISEFIEKYMKTTDQNENSPETGYIAQYNLFSQITQLGQDIEIPKLCGVNEHMTVNTVEYALTKRLEDDVEINAWFGPANTISPCHYDPKNNILVQVFGEKVIRLYPPCETPHLQPHSSSSLLFNTSQLDVQQEDLFEIYPEMQNVSYCDVILHAGEALFIPPKWWHYVKSLSPSFSVSFWF